MGIWARNKTGENQFSHIPDALTQLTHRGPDHQAYKIRSNVALGHTRLSIIDLSEQAHQPFSDETGRYHLVFNGEIYNYRQIRESLQKEGIVFTSQSDTEVLLKLLIHRGEAGLHELNGFFAFIFWDEVSRKLLAVRDRLGIKPLLYSITGDAVFFASELKPLLHFELDKSIDEDALTRFFSYTFVPAPKTILKSVQKMLPGQLMRIEQDKIEFENYYRLEKKPRFSGSYKEAQNLLRTKLEKSIERRLIADVPVGSFLSGGLDSSIIAMLAKRQKKDLHTFSIGFDHPYFNESVFAEEVARHIGSTHETIVLNKQTFNAAFEPFLDSLDEPFADSSAFAVYLLSEYTRKQVTVSLSGDGADELFGGYRKHAAEVQIREAGMVKKMLVKSGARVLGNSNESRSSRTGDLKRRLHKFAAGMDMSADERYDTWARWISSADCRYLLAKSGQDFTWKDSIIDLNDFLLRDQRFVLPDDMLKKVDQMSMAHALEVRVPFLDHELVEFANTLPADWKVTSKATKLILRDTFKDDLPQSILKRSKKGFEIPLHAWLNEALDAIFNAPYFSRQYLTDQGLFNPEFIRSLRDDWKKGKAGERIYLVWALIIFQRWYHQNLYRA